MRIIDILSRNYGDKETAAKIAERFNDSGFGNVEIKFRREDIAHYCDLCEEVIVIEGDLAGMVDDNELRAPCRADRIRWGVSFNPDFLNGYCYKDEWFSVDGRKLESDDISFRRDAFDRKVIDRIKAVFESGADERTPFVFRELSKALILERASRYRDQSSDEMIWRGAPTDKSIYYAKRAQRIMEAAENACEGIHDLAVRMEHGVLVFTGEYHGEYDYGSAGVEPYSMDVRISVIPDFENGAVVRPGHYPDDTQEGRFRHINRGRYYPKDGEKKAAAIIEKAMFAITDKDIHKEKDKSGASPKKAVPVRQRLM